MYSVIGPDTGRYGKVLEWSLRQLGDTPSRSHPRTFLRIDRFQESCPRT